MLFIIHCSQEVLYTFQLILSSMFKACFQVETFQLILKDWLLNILWITVWMPNIFGGMSVTFFFFFGVIEWAVKLQVFSSDR